jgi:hypothetical protein
MMKTEGNQMMMITVAMETPWMIQTTTAMPQLRMKLLIILTKPKESTIPQKALPQVAVEEVEG